MPRPVALADSRSEPLCLASPRAGALRSLVGLVALVATLGSPPPALAQELAPGEALYEARLRNLWDASDHVDDQPLPVGAHFTSLIGDSHVPGLPLWADGELATPGVELVAETGFVSAILGEINDRIDAGDALGIVENRVEFLVDTTRSSVSALSMIAPSPDYFLGVSDLSLRDENGWIPQLVVDLGAWDAGTEDGDLFQLDPNNPTSPQELIAERLFPFREDVVVGRLTFTLVPEPAASASSVLALLGLLGMRRVRVESRRSAAERS